MAVLFIIGKSNITRLLVCETAEDNTAILSCNDSKVIHILSAMYSVYGRKERGTCHSCHLYVKGCDTDCEKHDSLRRVKDRCEGLQSCHFKADNDFFGDPCHGTGKYIQLAYQCVIELGMQFYLMFIL